MENISEQRKNQLKHLAFYLHEQRKWKRVVNYHACWTVPLIACTLIAAYKKQGLETIAAGGASTVGLYCVHRANFYRRQAEYRVRFQKRKLQKN